MGKRQAYRSQGTINAIELTKDTENYIEWKEKGKLDIDTRAFKEDKYSGTITTDQKQKVYLNSLRIRKFTPLECCRIMGLPDYIDERLATKLSASARYHIYGDGLVPVIPYKIFKELL